MKKGLSTLGILTVVAVAGCGQPFSVDDGIVGKPKSGTGPMVGYTFLDQEWDNEHRDQFYNTPQGNLIIPYEWFLHLETAESPNEPSANKPLIYFRGDENIEKLRYLAGHKTDLNMDRLPVGFTKEKYDTDRWGIDGELTWLGMNCAACHTSQINFGGNKIRIDGGPTMADFIGFLEDLNKALKATMMPGPKFDRFAAKIGGQNLQEKMKKVLAIREGWTRRNNPKTKLVDGKPTVKDGNARLDAFGSIFNEAEFAASGLEPDDHDEIFKPERNKRRRTNAPVSYPFLWGTRWHDWVQWPANAPRVPMARNLTQVMGVFGRLDTTEKGILGSYESSMRLENLRNLADMIVNLRSPSWPEEIFGPIDKSPDSQWARGKKLFKEHCVECHKIVKRKEPQRRINVHLTKLQNLGTDPMMVRNFLNRKVDPGILKGRGIIDSLPISRLEGKNEATAVDLIAHFVARSVSDDLGETVRAIVDVVGTFLQRKFNQDKIEIYKGRPLEGIWATAPYLHNGSVPTLAELMKSPKDRIKKFWVGSREFLKKEVGFNYKNYSNEEQGYLFEFDTTIPGNSNSGHEYPVPSVKVLTEIEREALVIYQKSL